jgi:hypothetical protein
VPLPDPGGPSKIISISFLLFSDKAAFAACAKS